MTDEESLRIAGNIGLMATLVLVVVLVVHPFGRTELYDDGVRFSDHIGGFWIVIHVVAVLALIASPLVIGIWARALGTVGARIVGQWASVVATLGMALGALHLVGTDTMTFVFFEDTLQAGGDSEATLTSADLLLRLHGATLFTWVLAFWFAVPALLAVAVGLDDRLPRWLSALAAASALFQVAALGVTASASQWTTLSETILFRTGATLLLAFLLLQSLSMRTGSVDRVLPRQWATTS